MGPNDSELTGELIFIVVSITLLVLTLVFWPGTSHGAEIDKTKFVDTIIGEAEGESYRGKLAVACAIRERGTLDGCYGWMSPRVRLHEYSAKVFVDSVRAYEESAHANKCEFVKGATHWQSREDLAKHPAWLKNFHFVRRVGGHWFFKHK